MNDNAGNPRWAAGTSSTLKPDTIQIGLETTNNSYSVTHADAEEYINNQYKSATDSAFHYQTATGTNIQTSPPTFTWLTAPAPGNNGGHAYVTCCP